MTQSRSKWILGAGLLIAALVVLFFVSREVIQPSDGDDSASSEPTAMTAADVQSHSDDLASTTEPDTSYEATDRNPPASDHVLTGDVGEAADAEGESTADPRTAELEAFSFRRSVMNGIEGRRFFLTQCWEGVLELEPEAEDLVMLEMYARPSSGDPSRSSVELIAIESRNMPPEAVDCFSEEVERLVFPAPPRSAWDDSGGVTVRYPLILNTSDLEEADNSVSR